MGGVINRAGLQGLCSRTPVESQSRTHAKHAVNTGTTIQSTVTHSVLRTVGSMSVRGMPISVKIVSRSSKLSKSNVISVE